MHEYYIASHLHLVVFLTTTFFPVYGEISMAMCEQAPLVKYPFSAFNLVYSIIGFRSINTDTILG